MFETVEERARFAEMVLRPDGGDALVEFPSEYNDGLTRYYRKLNSAFLRVVADPAEQARRRAALEKIMRGRKSPWREDE